MCVDTQQHPDYRFMLSRYGLNPDENWQKDDLKAMWGELGLMVIALSPYIGGSSTDAFTGFFGATDIGSNLGGGDDNDIGCARTGDGFSCTPGTVGRMNRSGQRGLFIHEFGHIFNAIFANNGLTTPYDLLGRTTITINGVHVTGLLGGTFQRTDFGYRSRRPPDQQHPLAMDANGNTAGEDFADMFMNWVQGSFKNNSYGYARNIWMGQAMANLFWNNPLTVTPMD